ncbi:MAG: nicotinamide-nucleotide amidase [Gammaproteobacteria bacterium]|nr:nicotinamide-nucleotide amidase [Gammaproteobacteria bacterium]MBU1656121.1 nicotinamide-nucleotide amidase [Gammaproteobacteria bacterium]MBU1960515.1 nicotinamide-nucleotide amidase [Gammaproteobacteria bacterium]
MELNLNESMILLPQRLGEELARRGMRLAVAESCTGGWIAKALTDVPGSSAWFDRGYLTYSNEAKQEMLGVDGAILRERGAVSEETVRAMAAGALERSPADLAVAVSGIAGPGGGSEAKPVGTVWLAWAERNGPSLARRQQFSGDRTQVRAQAVVAALQGLLDLLQDGSV